MCRVASAASALELAFCAPSMVPPLLQSQRLRIWMLGLVVGVLPAFTVQKMMESKKLRFCSRHPREKFCLMCSAALVVASV